MTLQQWLFSFKGRLGRRDFWLSIAMWLLLMTILFTLANYNIIAIQTISFIIVILLWPMAAIIVKRLHDRNKAGGWALLLIVAWLLSAGNWSMLSTLWQWGIGRFIPTLIMVMMMLDLGVFSGALTENRFGPPTPPLRLCWWKK